MTAIKNLHPAFSIIDESVDQPGRDKCRLLIELDAGEITFALYNEISNRFIGLRRYQFESLAMMNDIAGCDELLIQGNYNRVLCSVVNLKSTLIPSAFYDEKNKAALLAFNHDVLPGDLICSNKFKLFDAYCIFSLPAELSKFLSDNFPGAEWIHCSVPMIESLLLRNKGTRHPNVHVNMHNAQMELAVIQNGQLQFYNAFHYQAPEDFIYFILFVYEQLELNTETTPLELSGRIHPQSAYHSLTTKYIRQVKFTPRTTNSNFSYGFDSLPAHEYVHLFELNLCAL